jgi:sugar lactone lactonase YvrE
MFSATPGATGASGTFSANPPMPILTTQTGSATAPTLTANAIGGTFTVTASVNALSVTFTLTNLAPTLGASSALVGSAAGSGSVLLLASGAWTASSNVSWLQLSAGSTGGTGNALIQFSYGANPNATAQTGTLTISGLTFTVTQAGAGSSLIGVVTTLVASGLSSPNGVAVDGPGNLYIADGSNNAVKEWSVSTQQVSTLVSSGLNAPTGVAVDAHGNVYIADSKNNAVKQWSVATGQVTSLVSTGLSSPIGVAVDSQGNVYFSDAGHNAIKEWVAATKAVNSLVSTGLNIPLGVAVDIEGNVYFADSKNNAIKEWSPVGKTVSTLVNSGLNTPDGVAVDGDGNVYIADTNDYAIKEWSPVTHVVTTLVSSGLKAPGGVAVGQGNVYIADTGDNAIKKYTAVYLSMGATSRNEGAAAATDSISFQVLPASTPLTATSNQSWLTITGTGGGAIGFSFQANTSVTSRTAKITVLGQAVTVTQSGDVPASVTKIAGGGQSTPVGQAFATALEVRVTDAAGNGVQGAAVTFTVVPGSKGAAGTFSSSPPMPILTGATGYAIAPILTANSVAGTFTVTANVGTLATTFNLTSH